MATMAARRPGTDQRLGWCDGQWAGDKQLVTIAKQLCTDQEWLDVPGHQIMVQASATNPVAVYALLLDVRVCGPLSTVVGDIPDVQIAVYGAIALIEPDDLLDAQSGAVA